MRMRELGGTGLRVSELALGGHEYLANGRSRGFNEDMRLAVTPGYVAPGYGGPRRREVLAAAYSLGINIFDVTIDSEKEALGRNLRELPPPYEIFVQTRPEGMCYSYDRNNRKMLDLGLLRAEVQRGLKLLQRETLDLLNVGLLAWSIDNDPDYLATVSHNISTLKREGLVRFAVADSFSGERLYLAMLACGAFDVINVDLNFGDACAVAKVLPQARAAGVGLIAREAFFKGELFAIAAECGLEDRGLVARVALKWVAQQRPDCIIVGVDNAAQLEANALAVDSVEYTPGEAAILDRLRAAPRFAAYETAKTKEFMETPA